MANLPEVTAFLHAEIPITRAMGIELAAWDGQMVTVRAPLAPNQNHADTAFGGSISTIGIFAGFSLLYLLFLDRKMSTRILIQKSATEYLRPIDADMTATAAFASPEALEEFLATMTRRRKARLEISSKVLCNTLVAATHTGLFVAMIY